MKYKRVVITRHGGPEVLQVVEDELPEPQAGQVRVKILAAGIANTDTMLRAEQRARPWRAIPALYARQRTGWRGGQARRGGIHPRGGADGRLPV